MFLTYVVAHVYWNSYRFWSVNRGVIDQLDLCFVEFNRVSSLLQFRGGSVIDKRYFRVGVE